MKNIIKRLLVVGGGLILIGCNSGGGSGIGHIAGSLVALGTVAAGTSPAGIRISPDGANVYVANLSSNTVSQYSRDQATGILTPLSTPTIATGNAPYGIIISQDGSNVYVTNQQSNSISQYNRGAGGILTALGTIGTGNNPLGIAISPLGNYVYVTNFSSDRTVSQYSRGAGGILTPIGTVATDRGSKPFGISISPDGRNVYVSDGIIAFIVPYSRNTSNGILSYGIPPANLNVRSGANPTGIIVSPDGKNVYVANNGSNTISQYSRNSGSGQLTFISDVATGILPAEIAISPDGLNTYVTNVIDGTISQYRR